jgi:hypothetical protein
VPTVPGCHDDVAVIEQFLTTAVYLTVQVYPNYSDLMNGFTAAFLSGISDIGPRAYTNVNVVFLISQVTAMLSEIDYLLRL